LLLVDVVIHYLHTAGHILKLHQCTLFSFLFVSPCWRKLILTCDFKYRWLSNGTMTRPENDFSKHGVECVHKCLVVKENISCIHCETSDSCSQRARLTTQTCRCFTQCKLKWLAIKLQVPLHARTLLFCLGAGEMTHKVFKDFITLKNIVLYFE
jgi:hypothetical protein